MGIYHRMIDSLSTQLSEIGIPQEDAVRASVMAIDRIRFEYGGTDVYLPKKHPWRSLSERNASIRREFNGRNLEEIKRKYGLHRTHIYRICARSRHE